jgi:hypothetical protein
MLHMMLYDIRHAMRRLRAACGVAPLASQTLSLHRHDDMTT